jgi:hypothetical protein
MKGSIMLPCRLNQIVFSAVGIAGCIFATAGLAQHFDASLVEPSIQHDDFTLGGQFNLGIATIDLHHTSISNGFDEGLALSVDRDEISSASFTLNLSDGHSRSSLFPESLSVRTQRTDFLGRPPISPGALAVQDINDQDKSDYMISADWGPLENKYTFTFSSSYLSGSVNDRESTELNNDSLSFTRTLQTGGWLSSFTARAGWGYREEAGDREHTQQVGASANFKTVPTLATQFDITAKVFRDRVLKTAPGTGDIDTRWELRAGSKILGAKSRDDLTIQPSLSIFFSLAGSAPDSELEDKTPIDYSAGLAGKIHF